MHDDFVLVPADKAANNAIVVCKKYHVQTLIKALGINWVSASPISVPTSHIFHQLTHLMKSYRVIVNL